MKIRRRWGIILALTLAAHAPGCATQRHQPEGAGSVALSVSAAALSRAADVKTVAVRMASVDSQWTAEATLTADPAGGGFRRIFEAVPAGSYDFHAEARDAAGNVLFETPSPYPEAPVRVFAGQTTTVHLLLQERGADPYRNGAPYFLSVTASEQSLDSVRSVLLSATAADPDGDAIAFTWSAAGGTFGAQVDTGGTSSTRWTPPGDGDHTVKVVVADGKGASAAHEIAVHVAGGAATVVVIVDLNAAPVVTGMTAAELRAGQPVVVTATASDVDGDAVTFGPWTATCQGSFSSQALGAGGASSTAVFTVAAGQPTGSCTISVAVSDGRGGRSSGALTFSLAAVQTGEDHAPRSLAILGTSDLHANLMPWNYFSAAADQKVGLAKIATLVGQERAANPCTLLVDAGDTIQGTPLGTYYALVDQTTRHPMAVAMSALGYDAMTAGNHEFNYGLGTLGRFQRDAAFPVLSANVRRKGDGSAAFTPYVLKTVCGVKVGVLGLTTPGITTWDAENTSELQVELPVEAAARYVPELRALGAEVVVVAFHAGPDRTPATAGDAGWLTDPAGWLPGGGLEHENDVLQLARQVAGIDVVLTGHTHLAIPRLPVGDVIVVQPNRWGSHLAEVKLDLEYAAGRWRVAGRDSRLLAVTAAVAADPTITALAQPYHDATVAYVDQPIGTAVAPFPGGDAARFVDSPLTDLINTVQMDAAARAGFPVDVSLAAVFNDTGRIPQGQIRLRDAYSAYVYDNTLHVVEVDGATLRRALEQDAAYFATLDPASLPASAAATKAANARDYNWDLYSGIDYTIDLTRPVGSRVTRLTLRGADVTDDQRVRVAINNYRAGGGGYSAFAGATVLWRSQDGVRDYLAAYVAAHPGLDPDAINVCNFTLVPELSGRYFPDAHAKCAGGASDAVPVKILAINDLHGQIGTGKTVSGRAVGSAGVLAGYLRSAMAGIESHTVLVEAGDLVGASPADSALLQDEPAVAFFGLLANDRCARMPAPADQVAGIGRFDVLFDPLCNLVGVPGNHELDEGLDELLRLLGGGNHARGPFLQDPWPGARFPVVSANIRRDTGELLFRPYVVKTVEGVPVAFVGATLTSTPSIVLPSGVAGLVFEEEVAAVNAQVAELQARGVHAIVVVLHDGASQSGSYTGATRGGQQVPAELLSLVARLDADVDVLITGHAHGFGNAYVPNAGGRQVLVTQAWSAGTAFANVDLTVSASTGDVTAATASVVTTYADGITPDPAAVALTAAADALVAPLTSVQVGTSSAVATRTLNGAGESPLGDLLAEAHRVAMGADFGITNPGGMRADLPVTCAASPCAITWNDCFTTQPFANQVMRVSLTGQQLLDALEQQFEGWNGQTKTRMLQISGFTYAWSASAPLGSRVVGGSLRRADGTAVDPAARYTVAMNNFLQGGGDGFTVLRGGTDVIPGPVDLDALIAYLATGTIAPRTDGRIATVP